MKIRPTGVGRLHVVNTPSLPNTSGAAEDTAGAATFRVTSLASHVYILGGRPATNKENTISVGVSAARNYSDTLDPWVNLLDRSEVVPISYQTTLSCKPFCGGGLSCKQHD